MKEIDFTEISYLKLGNDKQREAYGILDEINIFTILKEYNPLLVGTIPIGIDIESSDLDIVCYVEDFKKFIDILEDNFSRYDEFIIRRVDNDIILCNFKFKNMEIEIYSSTTKSDETNGFRHMIIEHKILNLYDEDFKNKIIDLKKKGYKTEPAFAKLLDINGNPYEELLHYEERFIDYN